MYRAFLIDAQLTADECDRLTCFVVMTSRETPSTFFVYHPMLETDASSLFYL